MRHAFRVFQPDVVFHLAAESHVDRSIDSPLEFVRTNVTGTAVLLNEALAYWQSLDHAARTFRFVHVSTDEVFGSLGDTGFFTESNAYDPHSPYAATKAAADHLVRAWNHTYGLPTLITNCSNNYGPYQFPEKLIPHMIIRALSGQTLPVYGTGNNVRDWLHVDDHVSALCAVAQKGQVGETYLISGRGERRNIDIVTMLSDALDTERPRADGASYATQIQLVTDRPGHDFRYAIDAHKLQSEIGWQPTHELEDGMRDTVRWYLANASWWQRIISGSYQTDRQGLVTP